ncbi:MAG: hypothetical protein FJ298_04820 [Planctomycetes bacterium]|nr:hypothetical protein [Planctomycetota bacterium]
MAHVQYDPTIIRNFVDRLYFRAAIVTWLYTLIFSALGGLIGGAIAYNNGGEWNFPLLALGVMLGIALLGSLGWYLGTRASLFVKMQAQLALCQIKIEENTRPTP